MDGSAAIVMAEPAREVLRDGRGNILGSYDARSDTTRDAAGRQVGRGYLLPMLLSR